VHVSSCSVALVPAGYRPPAHGAWAIGAAFTPTAEGHRALRAAAALAFAGGGRLWAFAALEPADHPAEGVLRDALAALPPGLPVEVELRAGAPVDVLVAASRRLDLLTLGSRASGPPCAVRLGAVSRAVVESAACPVLLVPRAPAPAGRLTPIG
jgi:nucleotide-binding universal stress UspA family protein